MSNQTDRYRVRAVQRALDVLGAFSISEPELGLGDVSSRVGLSTTTVYRLLANLESRGYVERNSQTGTYCLGVACLDLGTIFLSQLDLRERVLPILEGLRQQCKETLHLAILDRNHMEVIYLEKLEGLLPIGMMGSRVGGRAPAYCTGLGRCMLAHLDEVEVREFYSVAGLPARTPRTITDLGELQRELKKVRQTSYAIDNGEHEVGVKCVATPVWNHQGAVVAAMSVSGPGERIDGLVAEHDLVGKVRAAGQEASARMGYAGQRR